MRPKEFDFDPDPDGIAESQTTVGAADLTLDGVLVSGGVATLDYARRLAIASSGNDSTNDFTVTGTDADGRALVEVVTGPNTTTVETVGYFKTVTSVAIDGATVGNITVGTTDELASQTIPIDYASSVAAAIGVDVTGTIDYTVQQTIEPIQGAAFKPQQDAAWHDITALAAKTADLIATAAIGATAIRLVVNSYSTTAELQMHVSQPSSQ
jgi:hypothetical protein